MFSENIKEIMKMAELVEPKIEDWEFIEDQPENLLFASYRKSKKFGRVIAIDLQTEEVLEWAKIDKDNVAADTSPTEIVVDGIVCTPAKIPLDIVEDCDGQAYTPVKFKPFDMIIKNQREPLTPSQRFEIMSRDKFRCQLCGATAKHNARLEIDHKIPVKKGGTNDLDNLWTLCFNCNRSKAAREIDV